LSFYSSAQRDRKETTLEPVQRIRDDLIYRIGAEGAQPDDVGFAVLPL